MSEHTTLFMYMLIYNFRCCRNTVKDTLWHINSTVLYNPSLYRSEHIGLPHLTPWKGRHHNAKSFRHPCTANLWILDYKFGKIKDAVLRCGRVPRLFNTGVSMTSSGTDRWGSSATTARHDHIWYELLAAANVNDTLPPTTAWPGHVIDAERGTGSGSNLACVAMRGAINLSDVNYGFVVFSCKTFERKIMLKAGQLMRGYNWNKTETKQMQNVLFQFYYPNVTTLCLGLCCRNSVCLSVCLSSVTLVHPTHGVEPFGKISSPLCTLAILWPPCKILRR